MLGYLAAGNCVPAAVADIKEENAQSFAEKYGMERPYTDYHAMLKEANLDVVSIATWPHLHAEMVIAAANAGVKAIHCEKPMARTWGEAKAMVEVCDRHNVQLTFNHQRRFLEPFRTAKEIAHSGEIGEVTRIEGQTGDIFDWGTHWLDMFFMYNNETPAEWVIGQIDARTVRQIFGHPVESQAVCLFRFQNGVKGYLETGYKAGVGAENRIIGTKGMVEVHNDQPCVRVKVNGQERGIETAEGLHGDAAIARGIADLLACLESGEEPELSAHRAIRSTEVIFATYESSRRRGRVDLPLEEYDNALIGMMESGVVGSGPDEE
jgi:predicted dehydrogenase